MLRDLIFDVDYRTGSDIRDIYLGPFTNLPLDQIGLRTRTPDI